MDADAGLLINAVVSGLLIGGFYAAVSVGVAISFGMLDIVNIAHPAFILLGSYAAFIGNTVFGIDPILATVITLPAFYVLGLLAYQIYYVAFERRDDQSLRGLSFFFGLLFIAEVGLILAFGVDYRSVQAWYTTGNLNLGFIELPLALACAVPARHGDGGGPAALPVAHLHRPRHPGGGAGPAGAAADGRQPGEDQAHRLRPLASPRRRSAGAALIIIQPIEPSIGREYIGRIFAICVLGGLGSFPGMVIAALTLGVVENITATFFGPSWAPAVSFGVLLITLAVRPSGILGR